MTSPDSRSVQPPAVASRRKILGALATAPISAPAGALCAPSTSFALPTKDNFQLSVVLRRTAEGRQLSRVRYHNAERFFTVSSAIACPMSDKLYSTGIVMQLGLSSHLLDVGFEDPWCARNIGLHVSRSLSYANATGLDFESPELELLTGFLSPYSKWRDCCDDGNSITEFPFTDQEVQVLIRSLLDHVHVVTGHPRPRNWKGSTA